MYPSRGSGSLSLGLLSLASSISPSSPPLIYCRSTTTATIIIPPNNHHTSSSSSHIILCTSPHIPPIPRSRNQNSGTHLFSIIHVNEGV
ncbi:hypothetical protein EJ05DRAFT_476479 [Pseudovirgaria hyperparasitica]|uniref:REJ domain-containing protein n=1 Tax=Pseudovirgaria hyperparasitica TaxID=470096 RepID=A0A6A6W6P9_9PEZI|nr:uncharacterized protein EJ05DRAFT_476479 [Pseudovirgaria hyperparasitica]KAF2758215.1 hypothetical protein EJ05DRAFT_476479 [Pseudovirgaria hyperparasitica]